MDNIAKKPLQPETKKFSFNNFRITSVQYKENEAFKLGEGQSIDVSTDLAVDVHFDKEKNVLSLRMGIRLASPDAPFNFEVQGVGTFKFTQEPSEKDFNVLVDINCPAIMFPYMRAFIAELTMRGGHAPLHLPPLNFVALAEQKRKQREQQHKQPG